MTPRAKRLLERVAARWREHVRAAGEVPIGSDDEVCADLRWILRAVVEELGVTNERVQTSRGAVGCPMCSWMNHAVVHKHCDACFSVLRSADALSAILEAVGEDQ